MEKDIIPYVQSLKITINSILENFGKFQEKLENSDLNNSSLDKLRNNFESGLEKIDSIEFYIDEYGDD